MNETLHITQIDHCEEKLRHPHPCHPLGVGGALRGKIVSMVYLVVNIIKLSYKTLYIIVNDHSGDHMMLYRSRIDADLDEISHTCYLGLGFLMRNGAYGHESGVLGAVGRDQGRFR